MDLANLIYELIIIEYAPIHHHSDLLDQASFKRYYNVETPRMTTANAIAKTCRAEPSEIALAPPDIPGRLGAV